MPQMEHAVEVETTELLHLDSGIELNDTPFSEGKLLAEVAHDARNMVSALGLYCDLLDEPGVLSPSHRHYGNELKLVVAASRQLVEKLMNLEACNSVKKSMLSDTSLVAGGGPQGDLLATVAPTKRYWDILPAILIDNLALELQSNKHLLTALAGPAISLSLEIEGGELPVRLTNEDLTRILVNLVKNAAEAMPAGGRLHLTLRETSMGPGQDPWIILNFEDNGTGISQDSIAQIFESGYTTRIPRANGIWQGPHRGLGLSITRSIVESAGGHIHAANHDPKGACFQIDLPVRSA